jgi:V/A-type H+-transporting ATPase subunit A
MDLSAIISNFYSRSGYVILNNGESGSVTFIGTVSPAGGNLKEPVTESTKKVARCFYALAQSRADSKRYPAVDPIDSYSKYLEYPEIQEYLHNTVEENWIERVAESKNVILKGKEAAEQINILGDDGVPLEYHDRFWKSELIDFVILQQDAFDKIDSSTPMRRQKYMLDFVLEICRTSPAFATYEEYANNYKNLINILKQLNYSEFQSEKFTAYEKQIWEITQVGHVS